MLNFLTMFVVYVRERYFYFQVKREHSYEAIDSEIVGQAHLENYALKVFLFADNEDRASRFNK